MAMMNEPPPLVPDPEVRTVYQKRGFLVMRIKSQRSGNYYDVTLRRGKALSCVEVVSESTCPGWFFRKYCSHARLAEAEAARATDAPEQQQTPEEKRWSAPLNGDRTFHLFK